MPETRLGRWLYSLISSSASGESRDDLVAALSDDYAEPFTVIWYVLIMLVEQARESVSARITDISSEVAAAVSFRRSVDVSTVEQLMRVVLGYRGAAVPDCPVEDMLNMCVTLCVVLGRGVSDEDVEAMVAKAESAAAREGIDVP